MIDQLKKIAENYRKAAELLEKGPSNNKAVENLINENKIYIKELEISSGTLVKNIELTSKLK